jgi:uncharacterized protein
MIANLLAGTVRAGFVALALVAAMAAAQAQPQQPSANAIALAKDIIAAKGTAGMYDPIVPGVIERVKALVLQTNPMLSRDLNEVIGRMHTEYAPRTPQLFNEMATLYASRFTEQELKDALAFYKTPLGKKIIEIEPDILDRSVIRLQEWREKFFEEVIAKVRAEMKKKGHDL